MWWGGKKRAMAGEEGKWRGYCHWALGWTVHFWPGSQLFSWTSESITTKSSDSIWASPRYVYSWCHLATGCLLLTALAFMIHREVIVKVARSCLTLCDPTDYSQPFSSVHAILQARILKWVAIPFSRGSSQPRDWTQVSHIAGRFFTIWATREALMIHAHPNPTPYQSSSRFIHFIYI